MIGKYGRESNIKNNRKLMINISIRPSNYMEIIRKIKECTILQGCIIESPTMPYLMNLASWKAGIRGESKLRRSTRNLKKTIKIIIN